MMVPPGASDAVPAGRPALPLTSGPPAAARGRGVSSQGNAVSAQVTRRVLADLGSRFFRRAAQLDAEATNLRSKGYREALIARAASEGRPVTEEALLARIPKLESDAVYLRQHSFGQAERSQSASGP